MTPFDFGTQRPGKQTDQIKLEQGGNYTDLVLTRNEEALIAGGWDRCITKWKLPSKEVVYRFKAHDKAVWHVDLSPDGKRLLTASEDGTVAIWNADNGELIIRHRGGSQVTCAEFLSDGKHVIYATHEKEIVVWDPDANRILERYLGHAGEIYDLAIIPSTQQVITGSTDSTIRIWQPPMASSNK